MQMRKRERERFRRRPRQESEKVRKDATFSPIRFKSHGWDSLPCDFRRRWPDPKVRTRVRFELSRGLENLSEKSIFGLSFVLDRDKDGFILTIKKTTFAEKNFGFAVFPAKSFSSFRRKASQVSLSTKIRRCKSPASLSTPSIRLFVGN